MYCKDCKFWDNRWTGNSSGQCEIIDEGDDCKDIPSPNALLFYARVDDDSGLSAGVRTGPMFGCIRFVSSNLFK